ncbi:hypothetical protein HP548_02930 [Paenibacillus taichungensis]|uniref:Uncharacterized protein n=1 Tax=Paenibacillus taichungensis TaxID=484184 RepID=A0ABX2MGM2_9BACL|nr:hypothetical protein [Paenibacillus taichungensis]NUU53051.1 hypothetical protein [Paenibacillus taichungensis]
MLGVTPQVLRNDYYITDLPMLLFRQTQKIAEERLAQLHIAMGPNMTEDSFKGLVEMLGWPLQDEKQQQKEEFDAVGLRSLRARLEGRKDG